MTPPEGPADPGTTLDTETLLHHEIHESLRRAGFGRWQALWLTACMMKGVPLPQWLTDQLKSATPPDGPE